MVAMIVFMGSQVDGFPGNRKKEWSSMTVSQGFDRETNMIRQAIPILLVMITSTGVWAGEPETSGFSLTFFGGTAFNAATALKIEQTGQPPLEIDADWETRPLDQPFYWALRAGWRREGDGFELQLLHHKLYLENTTPEVEHFEVTHGFNILTAQYVKKFGWIDARLGAGVVVPHPETVVRGTHHEASDYVLGGPALMAGAGTEHFLTDHLLLAGEVQFVAGWAEVTVADGRADVTALGLHLLLGAGYAF